MTAFSAARDEYLQCLADEAAELSRYERTGNPNRWLRARKKSQEAFEALRAFRPDAGRNIGQRKG